MEVKTLGALAKEIGEDATVIFAVEQLGMTADYARFSIALENGEIDGDIENLSKSK